MEIKLVSITSPIIDELNSAEELIVYCARVSNPENQLNNETSPRLIKYLIKHKHWSPFEMVDMCVEIKTSRAIAAQILRHRSFSFQEFSQRYSVAQTIEDLELRNQAKSNRQSSTDVADSVWTAEAMSVMERSIQAYNNMIAMGVAKESARMVLPLGIQTTMYMKGSVRSWVHYLQLRCKEETQKEHREVANGIKKIFQENFSNVSAALEWED